MNSISLTKKLKKSAEEERFIRDAIMEQLENDDISKKEIRENRILEILITRGIIVHYYFQTHPPLCCSQS